jgi:hypothetical protein
MRRLPIALACIASISVSACGGGYGSPGTALPNTTAPQHSARQLVVAFAGTTTLSNARRTLALSGTKVTITLNGQVVGSGTLDSSGKAAIEVEQELPSGSTVLVSAGSVTASVVWNQTGEDAAVLVQVNPDGTLSVTVASGDQPTANPSPDDPNESQEDEDHDGTPTSVDAGKNNAVLPANLPVAVTSTCSSITLTPKDSKIAELRFEENVQDGEDGSKFKYEGPFTGAMTFALVSQSARIRIRLFDANNNQLLDVKAPIGAFTAQPGQATPAPCPSPSPSPAASP